MPHQFEIVIVDPKLYDELTARIEELGGFEIFSEPEHGFFPTEENVEIRHSPIPGRYSVTLWGIVITGGGYNLEFGVYEADDEVWKVRFKWEPATGALYCVIPWKAISSRLRLEMRLIRLMGKDYPASPLNRELRNEACRDLQKLAKRWPDQAQILADELDINFVLTPAT